MSHTILAVNTHHIGKIVKIDAFLEVFVQIKGAHRVQRLILHKNQPKGCLKWHFDFVWENLFPENPAILRNPLALYLLIWKLGSFVIPIDFFILPNFVLFIYN